MALLIEVLKSQSFIEKGLLVIFTAILTGLLVPVINSKLEQQKFREQRIFDSDMARQNKIIDAQNDLLNEVEYLVIGFYLRTSAVAWYKTRNLSKFEESLTTYDEKIWEFFANMQGIIGKSGRFTSRGVYMELQAFYSKIQELDVKLLNLLNKSPPDEEWKLFIEEIRNIYRPEFERIVNLLAEDYGLLIQNKPEPQR